MIHELQDREKLSEGRNFGVGFSILKKINKNDFETYLAFTACKDYLNDLVYIEKTKKSFNSDVHGYNHKNQDIFDNKRYFYLGVNILHYNKGKDWDKSEEAKEKLYNNQENIVKIINLLEDKINLFKSRTKFEKIDNIKNKNNKALIFKVPTFWIKYPFLISLLTLYIRCFFDIKEIKEGFYNNYKCFIIGDSYYVGNISKFFKIKKYKNINNYKYDYGVNDLYDIHDCGIKWWLNTIKI